VKVLVAPENAIALASLELTPTRVIGGQPVAAAVTLTKPAPAGGAQITIHATRRNIVSMPATVTVPEGAIAATFIVATEPVHGRKERAVELIAAYNGTNATTTLTILRSPIAATITQPPILCASTAFAPGLPQTAATVVQSVMPCHTD
jgi:hypothetical protein